MLMWGDIKTLQEKVGWLEDVQLKQGGSNG